MATIAEYPQPHLYRAYGAALLTSWISSAAWARALKEHLARGGDVAALLNEGAVQALKQQVRDLGGQVSMSACLCWWKGASKPHTRTLSVESSDLSDSSAEQHEVEVRLGIAGRHHYPLTQHPIAVCRGIYMLCADLHVVLLP